MRGGRRLAFPPLLVAGIVNITPDSFSDGRPDFSPAKALDCALKLASEGADILDLGGESTRPGAEAVGAEEEQRRVLPVLDNLHSLREGMRLSGRQFPLLSVDTWRSRTARAALEQGADMINDISGGLFDPAMADVLAQYKPAYVLGHCPAKPALMQRKATYNNILDNLAAHFEERLKALVAAGLPESRVALDPGIGFGKTLEHNLAILRNIETFHKFGRPLYVGLSRKSFFGDLLGLPLDKRDPATQTATALLAVKGVAVHRAHNVASARSALKLAESFF